MQVNECVTPEPTDVAFVRSSGKATKSQKRVLDHTVFL